MKQMKMHKNQICILLILCIALTSCMMQAGRYDLFAVRENTETGVEQQTGKDAGVSEVGTLDADNAVQLQSDRGVVGEKDSQQIETVKALPMKEDYRLEDASYGALAFALQKLSLSGNRKTDLTNYSDAVCVIMDQPFWRCADRLQKQYCYRADSIVDSHRVLISYLHRKDGEKESSIF